MALDPLPSDLMLGLGCIQSFPEVFIFDRLFRGSFPAVFLPAENPFGHAILDVNTVGDDCDCRAPRQCFKGGDRCHELHTVIGGFGRSTFELALFGHLVARFCLHHHTPAARAGIATAGAIGIGDEVKHGRLS